MDEVVTGLRGVDAVRADERREDAAFQELRAQIDQTAAERAARYNTPASGTDGPYRPASAEYFPRSGLW